jgi:hypothetical protein
MTTRTELAELIGAEIKVLKAIRRRIRDLPPEEVAEAYCKIRQLKLRSPASIADPGRLRYGDACLSFERPCWTGETAPLPAECE